MKRKLQIILGVFAICSVISLNSLGQSTSYEVYYPTEFHETLPLREIVKEHPYVQKKRQRSEMELIRESLDRKHRIPQTFLYSVEDGPEYGEDPAVRQTEMGKRKINSSRAVIKDWAGQVASGFRPYDPTGAAGPNHYVQAINGTPYKVFNKSTGANMLTANISTLWDPATDDDGDPIIMYDKYADRWFVSQFGQTGNSIYIAISKTNDPTGEYYAYTYTSPQFPDYLKFSIWENGYYMTSNQSTDKVFCFERDEMLAGNPSARSISATFTTGSVDAFFVPLPADAADDELPAAGTPLPFFAYYDNAWGGGTDGVKIWNMTVTWGTTAAASISASTQVNTSAFDASYDSGWDDVVQPGTTQKLDGIGGIPTFRAQWRPWSGYNSLLLNWGVVISSTQRSIRWVELRQSQSTGTWTLYQEGTYTPDAHTRWLGSIAMDDNGSIALAYCKSSSSVYPSLCYTGRLAGDALGTMSFAETVVAAGVSSQTSGNRVGDYSHTSLDPDGQTFWHTGEYMGSGGSALTRVFSFQIPAPSNPPVADFSGTPTNLEAGNSVAFTDLSTENPNTWNWTFEGGTPASSTSENPVVTYSTPGTYDVTLYVENAAGNDTKIVTNYITVNALSNPPVADFSASATDITVGQTVTFTDLSTNAPTSWAWTFAGGTPTSSTNQNPTVTYSVAGTYDVTLVATNAIGGSAPETKIAYISVLPPVSCAASATTEDEYISNVTFGSINNTSGFDGYGDYTAYSTDVDLGQSYAISITNAIYYSLDQVLVWIDWNQDGDFVDTDEAVFSDNGGGTTTSNPYVSSGSITVPATASTGATRMRIRLHYNSATYNGNTTPCGDSDYGDVEDYIVNVIAPVSNPPVADFSGTPTTLEEGNSVTYTNLSTENPTTFSWTFEGGTPATSTLENPVITYATQGTYDVTLYVENAAGNDTKTVTNYITVNPLSTPPVADFSADVTTIYTGETVTFTDLSTNGPTSWAWTFAGGTPASSTTQNQAVVYNVAGTYDVTLVATNGVGSSAPETKLGYIIVTDAPVVNAFSLDFEACTDYSTDFTPWSTVDGDGVASYGSNDFDFTGESTAMGFMAFNPALAALATPIATTHGGDRCGMAINPSDASQADDWLISDLLSLGTSSSITFWVLTVKPSTWGLEDYEVLVSTTDNSTTSFSVLPDAAAQQAPSTWTEVTYDLSAYDNQDIYVAIHSISTDKFIFFVDDISVNTTATGLTENINVDIEGISVYPNPTKNIINIETSEKGKVFVYNVLGQELINAKISSDITKISMNKFLEGNYVVKVVTDKQTKAFVITVER
ncbi:MAG TPA: hypothetical protein DDX39_05595 [Bacteroidales bacterium]|nr:MAG: hypothetical protein A2W98_06865 [Bacteroidetes bacterium GWF2_33_38]OFY73304.1 MAG: hypothetical protein A2265_05470 [Bacteroidetes bacterium RIFOXYA12_FULL_33_9]OFY87570.1 MAG: hypothetical protein A2236_11965 [Bacteroidetes bacterium RIFOXYA2_FULL_33_7]HBF88097.1 hypothetical protein [Bacteroidales bacterium]